MARMMAGAADAGPWRGETPTRSAGRRTWASTAWLVAGTIAVAVTSYTLSLQVAAERRDMERMARQNRALEADLKALDAELRVRMRMPQLQRWNDEVLGLVPISATQYLANPVQLAAYGTAPAAAAPRVQLAVRDELPAAPRAAAPLLVNAPQPAPAARAAAAEAAPARAPAPTVIAVAAPARPAAQPGPIARPAAEAPADLLQQVEMNFAGPAGPTP